MKTREEIREPILLEGESFTRESMLEYSLDQLDNPAAPGWKKDVFAFLRLFLDPENPGITQQSSGTTGDPKSFRLSREAMLNSARRTLEYFKLKGGETVLLCLPVHYIAGKMMVVRALLGGLDLIIREPSSRPLQDFEGSPDLAAMVPLQIEESLLHNDPLERISRLLIGGGELHPATRRRLAYLSRPELYETFGMTETYTHFALRRINGPVKDSGFRLLEGVRISIDPRGCLQVEVPGVTPGRVLTSDLVEVHRDGQGFNWLGRFDNLINSGGIKIIPELLEEQIRDCLGHECLVLSEADRKLGNRLVLLLEFPGKDPPVNSWMNLLRSRLASHEIPKRIQCVETLPRNNSMKADRTRARDLLL